MKNVYSLYGAERKQSVNGIIIMLRGMTEVVLTLVRGIRCQRRELLEAVARLYSSILEEEVSADRAAMMLQAQMAFVSLLLFSSATPLLCVLSLLWLLRSLLRLKGQE